MGKELVSEEISRFYYSEEISRFYYSTPYNSQDMGSN